MAGAFPSERQTDLFNCSICYEKYNLTGRRAKFLNCHHYFCESCLECLSGRHNRKKIVCPMCCEETKLGKHGVDELKFNHYLGQFVDVLQMGNPPVPSRVTPRTGSSSARSSMENSFPFPKPLQACPTHGPVPEIFYCKGCDVLVCPKCLSENHQGMSHTIVDTDEARQDFVRTISGSLGYIKSALERMLNAKEKLDANFVRKSKAVDNVLTGISANLGNLVEDLDTKTDNEIRNLSSKGMDQLNEMISLKTRIETLSNIVGEGDRKIKEKLAEAEELTHDDVMVSFVRPNGHEPARMSYCSFCSHPLQKNPPIIGIDSNAIHEYRCKNCLTIINHFPCAK